MPVTRENATECLSFVGMGIILVLVPEGLGRIYRRFSSKEELPEALDYTWETAWNTRLMHVDEKANGIEKLKLSSLPCPVQGHKG
jgi:hypothetical protein